MTPAIFIWLLVIVLLLLCSALISGSEVAFFSLRPVNLDSLKKKKSKAAEKVLHLLGKPDYLLGTILVSNNFVNVGVVIISAYVTSALFDFGYARGLEILVQVVLITFILLLFGEILPKIYANRNPAAFSMMMAPIIYALSYLLKPIVALLVHSTKLVNRRLASKPSNISMDELSDALELPSTEITEDEHILKGIVKFGNIDAKEIMRSRLDVFAINLSTPFSGLLKSILDSGYSRIPIFSESIDNIKGVLYIKDLLPHLHKTSNFKWQSLIRPPYYVPETKKISDLLEEFQVKKIHMAIVIDEYGGTSGIVTLEDIMEEIVGEITDEFDEDEIYYKKLDEHSYVFEGKTLLNDFYKVFSKPDDYFNDIRGDADTLAGLILEMKGEIPDKDEVFAYREFEFNTISVDNRRIKKIQVTFHPSHEKPF